MTWRIQHRVAYTHILIIFTGKKVTSLSEFRSTEKTSKTLMTHSRWLVFQSLRLVMLIFHPMRTNRQTVGFINLSGQQLLLFFCPPAADGVHANKKIQPTSAGDIMMASKLLYVVQNWTSVRIPGGKPSGPHDSFYTFWSSFLFVLFVCLFHSTVLYRSETNRTAKVFELYLQCLLCNMSLCFF